MLNKPFFSARAEESGYIHEQEVRRASTILKDVLFSSAFFPMYNDGLMWNIDLFFSEQNIN